MPYLLNVLYLFALLLASPWLLYRAIRTGRYRRGLGCKLAGLADPLPAGGVWFHGVSVGEVHLLRQVVAAFRRRHPATLCVLSTSTDTGYDEARRCFADLPVFFFPLDFSWAVRRTLRQVDPVLIVLAEGELWPNFLWAAQRRGVPVAVINGRMSPRSQRRYLSWPLRRLAGGLFRRLSLLAMQTEEYAQAVRTLGAAPARVHVTGSVKYDGVLMDRSNARTLELRRLLNVSSEDLIWIAGSTQAPEEEIVLSVFQRLRVVYPRLRLFLVPRQKDRFDEVAWLLQRNGVPFLRRSRITVNAATAPVVLVDSMGELGPLWGLADVAFVGGSLDGQRGGQNMIEPAAFGAAVVFGPHVWNFRATAERLLQAGGALSVSDATELERVVQHLLADDGERRERGEAARRFVLRQQGATDRTIDLLETLLPDKDAARQVA